MTTKIHRGTVISAKMKDTITVKVTSYKMHRKYQKKYIWHKKYHAHTAGKEVQEGDEVVIKETTPVSKTKNWFVVEVIK